MTGNSAGSNGGGGTGNSVALPPVGGGGVMLPAPKVQIYNPAAGPDVFVSAGHPSGGVPLQVFPTRYVKATVPGIPQAVFDDLAGYAPQVELLRFTRLRARENASGGNGIKSSGFVHPSHGPAASGDGSFTHGGAHGGTAFAVQAIRPTEWPILSSNAALDVTQGILGFMCLVPVAFRNASGNFQNVNALVPSHGLSRGGGGGMTRFPYQKKLSGAYYAFRLSIKDTSDPRGKRLHGPLSEVIYCGNSIFPFVPTGVDAFGRATARAALAADPLAVNFWFGKRVPG